MLVGFAIAALFVGLLGLIGGILLFSLLPLVLAVVALAGLVLALLVVAVMVLPNFITLDDLKPDILALVQQETGREITLGGPIGFTLWPVLGLQLRDLSIGNPPGFPDPIMLSARELAVGVTLTSLFSKDLDLRELRLIGGRINLSVNEAGEGNWLLRPRRESAGNATEEGEAPAPARRMHVRGIHIGRIEIKDTDLGYDFANGQGVDLLDMDLVLTMPDSTKTANLTGDAEYRGHTIAVGLDIGNPAALWAADSASPLRLDLAEGPHNTLQLTGRISRNGLEEGTLSLAVADLPALLNLADVRSSLPARTLTLTGALAATRSSLSLHDMRLSLDDLQITGTTELNGSRVSGEYDIGPLDLDPWLAELETRQAHSAARAPGDEEGPGTAAPRWASLTGDITAHLAGVTARGIPVGATTARARLQGGKLDVSMTPASLYGGTIDGDFTRDRRNVILSVTGEKVDMGPLLTRLTGRDRLTGRGSWSLTLRAPARGGDPLAALNGEGRFLFQDGALKGVNIPALVRQAKGVLAGNTRAFEDSGPVQTDFTELSGTCRINKGIVSNDDLKMLSPLLRITGKGTASLPNRTVDYRADTALVADLAGQGGLLQRRGLVIPILITGPFDNLRYQPDLQGLMVNTLGTTVPPLRDAPREGVEELFRGLFGGKP